MTFVLNSFQNCGVHCGSHCFPGVDPMAALWLLAARVDTTHHGTPVLPTLASHAHLLIRSHSLSLSHLLFILLIFLIFFILLILSSRTSSSFPLTSLHLCLPFISASWRLQ